MECSDEMICAATGRLRQISNTDLYYPIENYPTPHQQDIITATVAELISQNSLPNSGTNLIQDNPICAILYLLPLIHKGDNPGRPILSTINCPTELICQYLDGIYFSLVTKLPTFIKDTPNAIRLFYDFRSTDDYRHRYLFTMDICSLCINVPTAGLAALKYYLLYYPDENRPSTPTLLKLTDLVLNLSSFEFDGKYYIQIKGVAMGTKMGPSYACLFVGYVEEKMLLTYTGTKPIMLRRYNNDYVGISTSTKNELEDFMQYVNEFHPSSNYTYDISDTSVNFLDISISMTQHGLTTDIFYKDIDTHSYLRYESAHPPSCKQGIPYSQFLRLRRICNNDQTFERRSDEMSEFFSQRGFPVNTIKNSLRKASKITQSEAINKRKDMNNTGVPLTMKFSGITQRIAKAIKKTT